MADKNSNRVQAYSVSLDFLNSQKPIVKALKQGNTKYNFFIGNDISNHKTGVLEYEEVILQNIYDGVDMRFYSQEGEMRYDYIIRPYANPDNITMQVRGGLSNYIDNGNLVISTDIEPIVINELYSYQNIDNDNKETIKSEFDIVGDRIKFNIGEYNTSKELIIDPIVKIDYQVLTSEQSINILNDISSYHIHETAFCGYTNSPMFPATIGNFTAPNCMIIGNLDLIYNNQNWITFLGGSGNDYAN